MKSYLSALAAKEKFRRSSHPRWLRNLALLTAGTFCWTLVLATPVAALAHPSAKKHEGVRTLTLTEMKHIVGTTSPQIAVGNSGSFPVASAGGGGTYAWDISGPGAPTINHGDNTNPNGYACSVDWSTNTMTVTIPASAQVATGWAVIYKDSTGFFQGIFDTVAPSTLEGSGPPMMWAMSAPGKTGGTGGKTGGTTGNTGERVEQAHRAAPAERAAALSAQGIKAA